MSNRIGIDVGGTFTDLVLVDEKGVPTIAKVATTPSDPMNGVINAVKAAAEENGKSVEQLLGRCDTFIHGTTTATNALIQKKVAKTGLLCTKRHRHILFYRDAGKVEPYNLRMKYPAPLIPSYLTIGVEERINSEGNIEVALNEENVREAIRQLKKWNVEAIAVCLLWSIVNPAHEQKIADIINEEWPEIAYSISSEVQPLIREYHRTCATSIDASLKPIMTKYVKSLQKNLSERGLKHEFLMVLANGGVMAGSDSVKRPVYTVNSGPAMGPLIGKMYGEKAGTNNVIVIDMGGTSFDVSLVVDGIIPVSREQKIGADPLGIIVVEVTTLGAGGGSIAWVDPGGMPHVGPQSAGADPGPACYDMGGENPTVTDANLFLGYINPDNFLGGKMKLNTKLAQKFIHEKIAKPLKLTDQEAAEAILKIVEENMFTGIEDLTVRRGIDPRDFILVAGGGGGPLHAASLAQELGITKIIVPKFATALCALGMLTTDIKFDNALTFYTDSRDFNYNGVNDVLERLENMGRKELMKEGIDLKNIRVEVSTEARYPFQVWGIDVPLSGTRVDAKALPKIVQDFENLHEERYGAREPGQYVEFTHWRVVVSGIMPKVVVPEQQHKGKIATDAIKSERKAYFKSAGEFISTKVYDGRKLIYGNKLEGPAIIEEPGTTIIVPPKWSIDVNSTGDYMMKLG